MSRIFSNKDTSLQPLQDKTISIIGYGNQGRAHALNLRDSGLCVQVGSRLEGQARELSVKDGFAEYSIEEVTVNCEVLSILLPDEVIPEVYQQAIQPYLKGQKTFMFAHGFCVHHKLISLPEDADIVLVAPTGPGKQLRAFFEIGKGLPALIAVEQDSTGTAWPQGLAYAKALGCTRSGVIETTFAEETIVDLFCEQAVLCGGIPELIKNSFETLVEHGYQKELAYISCLKEVKLIADLLFDRGLNGMRGAISNTAKFGSALAGSKIIDSSVRHHLQTILEQIEHGSFAASFLAEKAQGFPCTKELLNSEQHSELVRTGRQLKDELKF